MPTRPFDVPADLYPFEDHWFDRDGAAMHYVDEGSGPPVVLLHGNPTWSFLYRDIIRALSGEVRCLAPDYPGFGFSENPPGYGYTAREHSAAVGQWLDHLALDEPFVLVVQDWGGPVGLSNAVQRPEQVAGLVVLNTWCWRANASALAFSHFMGGAIGRWLCLNRNFFATTIVRRLMATAADKPQAVLDAYAAPFPDREQRIPTWVFPREIRMNDDWLEGVKRDLATLRGKPMAMVWGMRDRAFGSEAVIAQWQAILGEVPVTRLPDADHYLQEDAPDAIVAAIRRVVGAVAEE